MLTESFREKAVRTKAMTLQRTIKAVIRPGEQSGYVADCLEIPVVTQGRTLGEVTRNLRGAVELHLEGEDLAELGLAPHLVFS
jgi:predicted RNase H-like HicB family nuclease